MPIGGTATVYHCWMVADDNGDVKGKGIGEWEFGTREIPKQMP